MNHHTNKKKHRTHKFKQVSGNKDSVTYIQEKAKSGPYILLQN